MTLLLTGETTFAAGIHAPTGYGNLEQIGISTLIPGIINLLLFLSFIVCFVFLLIGGFRWASSGGDKSAAESARGTLTAAVIGLIIVLAAWAIMWFVGEVFGVDITGASLFVPRLY